MSEQSAARTRARRTAIVVAVAGVAALLGLQSWTSTSSTAAPPGHHSPVRTSDPVADRDRAGEADGVVADGTTVLDDVPAVNRLDAALLGALRQASADAGIQLEINSGWRSPAYQQQLLDEAVSAYGSAAEAARWVATADTSPHVSGDAVDIDGSGAAWLSRHGATYGLCRVYDNEPWHFELRLDALDHGCPDTYADPTDDPRMQ